MIGRADERALIGRLLRDARSGRSGTLMFHGEPGVGKSALLDHAVDLAAGMRILRTTGVETEIDLAFAGLEQLVRPLLPLAQRLPARQSEALRGALGLIDHESKDRFLVAAATLSLLSEAAGDDPLLCVVEDAHWLDLPSVEVLAFAARRLHAEGVAFLAATRGQPWPGLPGARIGGLSVSEAGELLREHAEEITQDVRDRLAGDTDGNPLALSELTRFLSVEQLAGRKPLPRPLRLPARVQDAFLAQVRGLPEASQTLLLVAAADDTADPAVLFRTAAELGAGPAALEAAERAGLVSVDGQRIIFRHPLVRAAVYQGATFTGRMAVHRALARALDGEEQAGRRAWHLAATATGPDEDIARLLERSAETALQRGGPSVAAAAYERAAELSPDSADRGRLVLAAAQAAFRAGQADRAAALTDRIAANPDASDEVALLRGRIEFVRGSAVAAHALLLGTARRMAAGDPREAAAVLIEAARAAWNANAPDRFAEAAALLEALKPPAGDHLAPLVATTIAIGDLVAGRTADAVAGMRRETGPWLKLTRAGQDSGLDLEAVQASLGMAGATRITGDDAAGLELGAAIVAECRSRGLVSWLPGALINLSMTEAFAGRHPAALASGTEGLRIALDLGQPAAICSGKSLLAWLAAVSGEEERCRTLAAEAVELSEKHQFTAIAVIATWALGLLELSLGHPERALDRLLDRTWGPLVVPSVGCLITPDLVEAAARANRTDGIDEYLAWYETWADAAGQPWAGAAVHRCRALLGGEDAETRFEAAVRLHEQAGPDHRPYDAARTLLLYGQWLRRRRRRADARRHLAAAHEIFQRLGAAPWTERAGVELRATGQTVRRRDPVATRLTPQEMQVVRLVAEGGSNQDVAAQLFLSPRTVAYHLYKAFPKLGVGSRADLARLDLDALLD